MVSITANGLQPVRAAIPWYKVLYVQVLLAILLGIIVGWLFPDFAKNDWIKALGDGFIKLIKMVIAPIIFCTVVSGIAHIDDAKKVGRVGIKALVLFRDRLDLRPRDRAAYRQPGAARRRLQRAPGPGRGGAIRQTGQR